MQLQAYVATVEYVVNRFGAVFPIVVASIDKPNQPYVTVVLPQHIEKDQLPKLAQLSMGDQILIDLPDADYYMPGHEPTATLQSILHIGRNQPYNHCPSCGGELTIYENLWCSNPVCEGRLISRLNYFGSPEGINSQWLSHRDLAIGLLNTTKWRSLAPIFSSVEWNIVDEVTLPSTINRDIQGSVSLYIQHLITAMHNPQVGVVMLMSFLNALSYPGLTPKTSMVICENAMRSPQPMMTIAATFQEQSYLAGILGRPVHDPVTGYISKQLRPFTKEISYIADTLHAR